MWPYAAPADPVYFSTQNLCYNCRRPLRVFPSGAGRRVAGPSIVTVNCGTSHCLMTDQETIARFIFLRSLGWSFNRIAVELNVSKPTLIKWSRQHQFEIANLRATETEALAETLFGARHERWRTLAAQLKQIEVEIGKRGLEEISGSRLHGLASALRAEINREVGPVRFSEANQHIPMAEHIIARHEWPA